MIIAKNSSIFLFVIGILKLHDDLATRVNGDGVIKGILQEIQLRPFFVISFMEASVRLYDALVIKPDTVLSWDATGGIIKNKQSSKQILYYELTLAHPGVVNEDSLIPLTYMLSESHSLFTVVHWLSLFKEAYRKVSIFTFIYCCFPNVTLLTTKEQSVTDCCSVREI